MVLRFDPQIAPLCRVVEVFAAPVVVGPASAALEAEMSNLADELARQHAGKQPAEIEGLRAARDLYKAFGIDPTRTRPSSEALLQRVLKAQPLPRVSNAVDDRGHRRGFVWSLGTAATLLLMAFVLPVLTQRLQHLDALGRSLVVVAALAPAGVLAGGLALISSMTLGIRATLIAGDMLRTTGSPAGRATRTAQRWRRAGCGLRMFAGDADSPLFAPVQ